MLCSRAYYYLKKGDYENFDWNHEREKMHDFCHRVVTEDLSVVRIVMAESVFEKAQIRLKQTLTDKVSSFGRGQFTTY